MMKTILTMLSLLLLSACAGPRSIPGHLTYSQDGSPAYAVTCDKPFSDQQDCDTRAGEICEGFGYKVISHSDEPLSLGRSMSIRCNTVSGLYPGDDKYPPK